MFHSSINIQSQDFDCSTQIDKAYGGDLTMGAMVSFIGFCRDEAEALSALELEHYPGMCEKQIAAIIQQARQQWPIKSVHIIHRIGKIAVGEKIVLLLVGGAHRQPAFEAAQFIMDFIKTTAPFWKREIGKNGDKNGWVSARDSDNEAQKKWQVSA